MTTPAAPASATPAPKPTTATTATTATTTPASRTTTATFSAPPRGLSFPAFAPAAPPAPATTRDDPRLPDTPDKYDENELRAAVGAAPRAEGAAGKARAAGSGDRDDADDTDGELRPRRSPWSIVLGALGIVAVLGGGALVVLGSFNSDRYLLTCEAERAVPEQGRGFPPWGTRAMTGEAWRPLRIARETRCQPLETDDPLVLDRAYLAMVLEQATALLTAREVTRVDDAEALLKQALLLTRPPEHEPEPLARQRSEHHQEVERMLGDVTYWRATSRLREAAAALGDAARQFDAAVAQHPAHVSDAGAWAGYARRLAQDLRAGPTGEARPSAAVPPAPMAPSGPATAPPPASGSAEATDHPGVPLGTALPVEPDSGSDAPPAAAPAAPPDAGPPTGGVLL